jgi:hypothetical protein
VVPPINASARLKSTPFRTPSVNVLLYLIAVLLRRCP